MDQRIYWEERGHPHPGQRFKHGWIPIGLGGATDVVERVTGRMKAASTADVGKHYEHDPLDELSPKDMKAAARALGLQVPNVGYAGVRTALVRYAIRTHGPRPGLATTRHVASGFFNLPAEMEHKVVRLGDDPIGRLWYSKTGRWSTTGAGGTEHATANDALSALIAAYLRTKPISKTDLARP